jgi:hypothetical protein
MNEPTHTRPASLSARRPAQTAVVARIPMGRPGEAPLRALTLLAGGFLIALLAVGCGEEAPPPAEGDPSAQAVPGETTPTGEDPLPADDPLSEEADTIPPSPPGEEPPPPAAAPQAEAPPPELAGEEDAPLELESATGVLGITGTEATPTAVLRREEGGALGLTGTPARELMALSGATVRVEGRRAATPVGPGLEVTGYELLEIEGSAPHLGILERDPAGNWILRTQEGDAFRLVGLPQTGVQPGMKVWVTGQMDAEEQFLVNSYGVVAMGPAS